MSGNSNLLVILLWIFVGICSAVIGYYLGPDFDSS
jgi:hypothetical protein